MPKKYVVLSAILIAGAILGYFLIVSPLISLSDRNPALAIGLPLLLASVFLAVTANYFLVVRRTTDGGVVQVKGFVDYIGHGFLTRILLPLVLGIPALIGGLLTLYGLVKQFA